MHSAKDVIHTEVGHQDAKESEEHKEVVIARALQP